MTESLEQLTGRELDAAVAREVFGLEVKARVPYFDYDNVDAYSTDLNACREAELYMAVLLLHREYGEALKDVVAEKFPNTFTGWRVECAFADAETRCRAMLAAVRGRRDAD